MIPNNIAQKKIISKLESTTPLIEGLSKFKSVLNLIKNSPCTYPFLMFNVPHACNDSQ